MQNAHTSIWFQHMGCFWINTNHSWSSKETQEDIIWGSEKEERKRDKARDKSWGNAEETGCKMDPEFILFFHFLLHWIYSSLLSVVATVRNWTHAEVGCVEPLNVYQCTLWLLLLNAQSTLVLKHNVLIFLLNFIGNCGFQQLVVYSN